MPLALNLKKPSVRWPFFWVAPSAALKMKLGGWLVSLDSRFGVTNGNGKNFCRSLKRVANSIAALS